MCVSHSCWSHRLTVVKAVMTCACGSVVQTIRQCTKVLVWTMYPHSLLWTCTRRPTWRPVEIWMRSRSFEWKSIWDQQVSSIFKLRRMYVIPGCNVGQYWVQMLLNKCLLGVDVLSCWTTVGQIVFCFCGKMETFRKRYQKNSLVT